MDAPRKAEADTLAADVAAMMRALYRLKPQAQRLGVWINFEAAAVNLARSKTALKRIGYGSDQLADH